MFFWNSLAVSVIQQMLAIWSLVPLPFLKSLYIWKFSVPVLLKPDLENFEHNLASMWNDCSCAVVWAFFVIAFLWDWMKTDLFQSCGYGFFLICWHIEQSTLMASSLRIWNSSRGILSPLLTLFLVMLPKADLSSHSKMSGSKWVITLLWLSGSLRSFFV